MSVSSRHIQHAFGPLPKGSRLPTPAAELVGTHVVSICPHIRHAAGRLAAQHLHHASLHHPHKGTQEAIHALLSDLGLDVHGPMHGAPEMCHAYEQNAPLGVFLGGARRLTHHEPKTKRAAHMARAGIEHDLRDAHNRQPTASEIREMKLDLSRIARGGTMLEGGTLLEGGRQEGGGWFTDMAKHAVSAAKAASQHPMGQMMAHQAMQMAMAHPATQQLSAAHDGAASGAFGPAAQMALMMGKHAIGGADCGGQGCGDRRKPHEGVGFAEMNVHRGKKYTAAEKRQIVRDLERYGVGEPGVRRGTLYDAFRR